MRTMPLIEYKPHKFGKKARLLIDTANSIIAEYQDAGYDLTLRQLYYQFVARDILPNSKREYNRLGEIINDARLAGLIDFDAIVDRTRPTYTNSHFKDPKSILAAAAEQYRLNTRATQETYIEVWVEKEALLGVIEPVCQRLDVPYLACKGYMSLSAMRGASERIESAERDGRTAVIIHLGDHDPSGIDMSRDIEARLRLFRVSAKVDRIALNMEQINLYSPPPNFAKLTDTRSKDYIPEYGREAWELDALDPKVIVKLIEDAVGEYTDENRREELVEQQESHKLRLAYISERWKEI